MGVKRVDHVGIFVRDMEETLKLYEELFSVKPSYSETTEDGWQVVLVPIGQGARLELFSHPDPKYAIKLVGERGEGLHHFALEVDDVNQELEALSAKGVELIDKKARPGVAGPKVGFISPSSTKGVPIELVQKE
jgi:methylmalonyl-CoA/ethylmalonyl-CoA epimerase